MLKKALGANKNMKDKSVIGRVPLVVLAGVVLLLTGCAGGGKTVPASFCVKMVTGASAYKIGPGDTLRVVVWQNAELSANIPVRPDGRISTPLVNDIQASGKTPSELASDMEVLLAEFLRTPKVSVLVTGQGTANMIQVIGEVTNPQALPFREGMRMLDLLVAAGGMTDFAAGNRGKLVRQTDQGQLECRIKLKDLMTGDMSQNIGVYPGDVLVVPASRF